LFVASSLTRSERSQVQSQLGPTIRSIFETMITLYLYDRRSHEWKYTGTGACCVTQLRTSSNTYVMYVIDLISCRQVFVQNILKDMWYDVSEQDTFHMFATDVKQTFYLFIHMLVFVVI
jgi:hypothetical protein